MWLFASDKQDEVGQPYEYVHWTGPSYGDSRANLTSLYDMILDESYSHEMKANLDTAILLGGRFRVRINEVKNMKGDMVPKALFFEKVGEEMAGVPVPTGSPERFDQDDPDLPF